MRGTLLPHGGRIILSDTEKENPRLTKDITYPIKDTIKNGQGQQKHEDLTLFQRTTIAEQVLGLPREPSP
jgi:hypothetical protein